MEKVKAKKHLGQHFLTDLNIARNTAEALSFEGYTKVLEIGPGMGVLTQFLLEKSEIKAFVIEIDTESVVYLKQHFPSLENHIIEGDFLQINLNDYFKEPFAVVGNFPYNISSQIVFKVIDNKENIPEFAGMFQKEVAERICATHGNKVYGILSVLTQAYYDTEYLFTVDENVFNPPPKVKSGVMRMKRKCTTLPCSDALFKTIVKLSFGQRRKTIRNSLKSLNLSPELVQNTYFDKRPEQLSVQDFIELTQLVEKDL